MSDIKEKMIPEGAEDEAAELIYQKAGVLSMEDARDLARAAILAALNAWPGMIVGNSLFDGEPMAFLPLQKEPSNG